VAAALDECGAPFELLAPDAASERWPAMRFDRRVLFHPDGGRCRADATVAALQRRAAELGAHVRFNARAQLRVHGLGVEVDAGGTTWAAPVAVVTAGAWVSDVLDGQAATPPLTVTQEQVQHFTPVVDQEWPSFIHHRPKWIYGLLTPEEGVKVDEHFVGPVIDPDRRVERSAAHDEIMVRYVEEWFPGLDPTPHHRAECLYTTTPDEHFVIERVGPIVIGSPCSGHGFKFTPYIGRVLADLALQSD
jgi:sarcosine oxidase